MVERTTTSRFGADPIEIPMYVTSVEVPTETGDAADGGQPAAPADPVVLLRSGTGTWPNGDRAVRLGNAEEILITLPSNPFASMDAARHGAYLTRSIRGLRVEEDSRRDGEFEVSWTASVRAPVRWRPVSLRLYASPSLNVTVMTIVPRKARKVSSRSFVRAGLRIAREFGQRIEDELTLGALVESL